MSRETRLIARATTRAYASALAEGADTRAAFETACALYRRGHPRVCPRVLRRIVAELVRQAVPDAPPQGRLEAPSRGVIAAQNAYVRAIASGTKPDIAFDVARAAYRALYPGLAGAVLDSAVARALASEPNPSDTNGTQPGRIPVSDIGRAMDEPNASGGSETPPAPR